MIRETCSCGATFEVNGTTYELSREANSADLWRAKHKCVAPVTLLTEQTDSGPGLVDVIDAIDRVAANNGLLFELVMAYIKAQS
jgi:hypothetical protein